MPAVSSGRPVRLRVSPPFPKIQMKAGATARIRLTWIGLEQKNNPLIYVSGMPVNVNGQDVEDGEGFALETEPKSNAGVAEFEGIIDVIAFEEGTVVFRVPVSGDEEREVTCIIQPSDDEEDIDADDDEEDQSGVAAYVEDGEDDDEDSMTEALPKGQAVAGVPDEAVPSNFLAEDDTATPTPADGRNEETEQEEERLFSGSLSQLMPHPGYERKKAAAAASAGVPVRDPADATSHLPRSLEGSPLTNPDAEPTGSGPKAEPTPSHSTFITLPEATGTAKPASEPDAEPTASTTPPDGTPVETELASSDDVTKSVPLPVARPKTARRKNGRGWMTYFAAFGGIVAMIGIVALLVVGVYGFKNSYESMQSAQKDDAVTVESVVAVEPPAELPSEPVAQPPAEAPTAPEPIDVDGDGFATTDASGAVVDCDDENASVNPGAEDICGDGIDQDCDGKDLPCPAVVERLPLCPNFASGESIVNLAGEPAFVMACDDGTRRACPVSKTTTLSDGRFSFNVKDCVKQP